jgi:2,3-bisphosphoglycerate-dependent phosphoglycerate mutase
MPRVIAALVRHGDYRQLPGAPSAHQPFPLTDDGRQQARQAATGLLLEVQRHGWCIAEEIHSSMLLRAWETASIMADRLENAHRVRTYPDLAERSVGSAANLTVKQIEAIIHEDPRYDRLPEDWKSKSDFCLPLQGAESLMQAGNRVANHLLATMQELAQQVRKDTVKVFVGHGAAMRHAAYILGVLCFEDVARLSMYHAAPVYLECREGRWEHVAGSWKIRDSINDLD